jgi:hypothetical protein
MNLSFLLELFALFLTISVLLYLFVGDNALFRIVTYLFIGVVAGYMTVLIVANVLLPRLANLLLSGNLLLMIVGGVLVLLGLLSLFKLFPRLSQVGTIPMAILVGVGAAVAIGGAVFGTLFGQVGGTFNLFNVRQGGNLFSGVYVLVGAVSSLAYFQFTTRGRASASAPEETTVRRATWMEILAKIGQVFIGITLGAVFAGVYVAAISALVERLGFMFNTIIHILQSMKIL